MRRHLGAVVATLLVIGCGSGSGDFTLSNATVDASHACASGSNNAAYALHASVASHNGRSSPVTIKAVSAVMTLSAVHGGWLQQVGYRYDAENVAFTPNGVGAGSSATIELTVPSACTNQSKAGGPVSYGEYSVALTVTTSAGTFKIGSRNKHRIIAA